MRSRIVIVPLMVLFVLTLAQADSAFRFDLKASRIMGATKVGVAVSQKATAAYIPDGSVRIDGDLADWPKNAQALRAAGSKDPKDLDAVAYVGISPDSFYFGCEVTDDTQYQRDYGDRMWKFDSVQFALDPLFERTVGRYGDYVHEIGLCFVDGAPLVWRWHQPVGLKGEKVPGAELAVKFGEGKAIYEARIPLQELWPLRPELGTPCGFAYVVNDSDGGHDRERCVLWASGISAGKDASLFGVLEFPTDRFNTTAVTACFLLPLAPTPSTKPQEWLLDVYVKHAGKLTVDCDCQVEHGKSRGARISARTLMDVPAGVSKWRLSADLSEFAPARIRVRLKAALDGVKDQVPSPGANVYVYRPEE